MRSQLTVLLLIAMAAPMAAQDSPALQVPTIVTTGEAVVRRAPDLAFVTVAVEKRARSPRDAQAQNAAAMAAVQKGIIAGGVDREALRTVGYTVQQEFDFVNGRRVPREYVARNAFEVRLEAVERVGEVIDVAVQAGATSIGDVRFDLRDRSGAEREALRLAVVDARLRADAAAAGAGRAVDRVLKIDDNPQDSPRPLPMMARASMADAAGGVAPPLEPGTIEIHSQVRLTVTLK